MPLTEGFKVAIAETHEPIPMSDHKTSDLSQFYHFHQPIELLAFVVEATANILHPFIDPNRMLFTRHLKRFHLIGKIRFLCRTRHSGVGNRDPLLLSLYLCFTKRSRADNAH